MCYIYFAEFRASGKVWGFGTFKVKSNLLPLPNPIIPFPTNIVVDIDNTILIFGAFKTDMQTFCNPIQYLCLLRSPIWNIACRQPVSICQRGQNRLKLHWQHYNVQIKHWPIIVISLIPTKINTCLAYFSNR